MGCSAGTGTRCSAARGRGRVRAAWGRGVTEEVSSFFLFGYFHLSFSFNLLLTAYLPSLSPLHLGEGRGWAAWRGRVQAVRRQRGRE
jgi:hypothetical protein